MIRTISEIHFLYMARTIYRIMSHVSNGYPNLKLLKCLNWFFFIMLVLYGYISFPISQMLKGDFPQNSAKGQICMQSDFQVDEMNQKQRMTAFIGPFTISIFRYRFMKKLTDYVKGQNLKLKTFPQFGGNHQLNICTAAQTSSYHLLVLILIDVDNGLIIAFQMFGSWIDKNTQFFIHNFIWVLTLDIFFGVPVKHLIQSRSRIPSLWLEYEVILTKKFYVNTPPMSPRRYIKPTLEVCDKARTRSTKFTVCKFASSLEVTKPKLGSKRVHTFKGNFSQKHENTRITPED